LGGGNRGNNPLSKTPSHRTQLFEINKNEPLRCSSAADTHNERGVAFALFSSANAEKIVEKCRVSWVFVASPFLFVYNSKSFLMIFQKVSPAHLPILIRKVADYFQSAAIGPFFEKFLSMNLLLLHSRTGI
jgi:hypothetical protein